MKTAFGILFKSACDRHFIGTRAAARALEPDKDEATTQSYIGKIQKGERPPPLNRLEQWVTILKLTEEEREHFLDLGVIAHLPDEARPRFERILARIEALEKRLR